MGRSDASRAGSGSSGAHLGDFIRQRRLELGFSQEQLASMISTETEYVRQADISNLERGRVQLPRRSRLERIAAALDLSLGQLLARSGWAEADRHLAASLAGTPPIAAFTRPMAGVSNGAGHWWEGEVEAVRVVTARFAHDHFDTLIDGYRNIATWMATSGQGLCGFLLLVNHANREIVTIGFWSSEAAMTASMAGLALPEHVMRLGEQLAEPPTIERYRLLKRVVRRGEVRHRQLIQIDRATTTRDMEFIEHQFHDAIASLHDHDPALDRAALLVDQESQRGVAISIWNETEEEARREYDLKHATDVRFPQLVSPADSRHYVVVLEV